MNEKWKTLLFLDLYVMFGLQEKPEEMSGGSLKQRVWMLVLVRFISRHHLMNGVKYRSSLNCWWRKVKCQMIIFRGRRRW